MPFATDSNKSGLHYVDDIFVSLENGLWAVLGAGAG